jgi:YidC/Oxa1 family membrane protein insertase
MSPAPIFASTLGEIFQPLFKAMAWLIAFFYALIPNYAIAIALLTVTVMVITAPLTIKSTRSMLAMQRLQPEMKKLQAKYKGDRATLNDEMMKLYKEHGVNPAGGCLPMFVQFPVFIGLYDVIRGLTHTVTVHGKTVAEPYYIGHSTKLYQDLIATPGEMKAFGINLADSLFSHQSSWVGHVPYAIMVAVAIGVNYLSMRQMNRRNSASGQMAPQMQAMQKYMPLLFAVIYIRIAAGVNIYFIVSALCRMGLQSYAFHTGTKQLEARATETARPGIGAGAGSKKRRGFMEWLGDYQKQAIEQQQARQAAIASQGELGSRNEAEGSAGGPGGGQSKPGGSSAKGELPKKSGPVANGAGGASAVKGKGTSGNAAVDRDGAGGGEGQQTESSSNGGGSRSGSTTPAAKPGAGSGNGNRTKPPSSSNGGSGTRKQPPGPSDNDDDDSSKIQHPRSKSKRARKAR